jgi:hypothetical protein
MGMTNWREGSIRLSGIPEVLRMTHKEKISGFRNKKEYEI